MNRLFGTSKPTPTPQQTKTQVEQPQVQQKQNPTVDLTFQTKKLETRIQEINGNISVLEAELKTLYPKMKAAKGTQQTFYKQRIVNLLKKKKMLQDQVDAFLGQQITLERVAFTNETISNTIETTNALKVAVQAQKVAMKDIDIDKMEDLRDEMLEMQYDSKQIQELLSRNNYDVDEEEDELDAELQALDDELYLEQMSRGPTLNTTNKNVNVSGDNVSSLSNSQKSSDPYADLMNKINMQ